MSKFVSLAVFFLFAFELLVTAQAGPATCEELSPSDEAVEAASAAVMLERDASA
jgi:hypothetical protein